MSHHQLSEEGEEPQQKYNGQPTPTHLKSGPIDDGVRGCTDIFCCLLFVTFTIAAIAIGVYGLWAGQPSKIGRGYDADMRACGIDDLKDYPYIYFGYPKLGKLSRTVCVKKCPGKDFTGNIDCAKNSVFKDCQSHKVKLPEKKNSTRMLFQEQKFNYKVNTQDKQKFDIKISGSLNNHIVQKLQQQVKKQHRTQNNTQNSKSEQAIKFDEKKINIYPTYGMFEIACIPTSTAILKGMAPESAFAFKHFDKIKTDLSHTYPIIIAICFVALVLGFIFLILVRFCAGCVVWCTIILLFFVLIGLSVFCFLKYSNISINVDLNNISELSYEQILSKNRDINDNQSVFLFLGILFIVLSIILLIIVCCLYSRIKLAIAIVKTAAMFVGENFSSLLVPLVIFLLIFIQFIWFIVPGIYLYSIGEVKKDEDSMLPFSSFEHDNLTTGFICIHTFFLLWGLAFLVASADFILGSATAIWYFQKGTGIGENEGVHPIRSSVYRLFRFHLGSVSFGSLIIAIIWVLRIILEYVSQKLEENKASENGCIKFLISCCRCCLWCFESCIKFLNHNAYIWIAMTGENFCTSAKSAMFLMARNAVRFITCAGLGDIIINFGRFFIACSSTLIGYLIITQTEYYDGKVISPVVPTTIFFLIGLCIGSIFMSVYSTVTDSVLIVFCMDEEIEKQMKRTAAANCPEPLQEFMNKYVS